MYRSGHSSQPSNFMLRLREGQFRTGLLLEEDGFELVVPPRTKRAERAPGVAIWVSDLTLTGFGFVPASWMAGQEQSPLQERDRRFEAGLLQRCVLCEPRASA